MQLIRQSIERPVAVISIVIMVVMFGALALTTIPVQLAPDVNKPVINVTTIWPGAAPAEVEREIVDEQERVFKGLENLERIVSEANRGLSQVTLEFKVGTNMDKALLLVSNRLNRVPSYPAEALRPLLGTAGADDNPMAWFIVERLPDNTAPVVSFGDLIEDVVQERLERVPGVGATNVFGGSAKELQIIIRPDLMASYGITVEQLIGRLRAANIAISAGAVDEGKRRYTVRTDGELRTIESVEAVVVHSLHDETTGRQARVTVGDIATVKVGVKESTAQIRTMGNEAIAVNAVRENGANVIETMRLIRDAISKIEPQLAQHGLKITQVYDETDYIESAINLVQDNLLIGGLLAIIILFVFLRSVGSTIIIALAIPASVIGSFVAMAALGRSINVISLAGLAFAVGMVVDAAIVVLENIYRLRQNGESSEEAAYKGAAQVWGAVFVSALTTVMVFIPILVMELEVGQLFRDIAVAISVAVLLSLVVAITVIPALSKVLLTNVRPTLPRVPVLDHIGRGFAALVMGMVYVITTSRAVAAATVGIITLVTVGITQSAVPKLDYLPSGNRNLVIGFLLPPPGYNLATKAQIAQDLEKSSSHLWARGEYGREDVTPDANGKVPPPKIANFFFVTLADRNLTIIGAVAKDSRRAGELKNVLMQYAYQEPGTFGFFEQPSLFGRGVGGTAAVNVDITGPDLDELLGVALKVFIALGKDCPDDAKPQDCTKMFPRRESHQVRPMPELTYGAPEVRVIPDPVRLADAGVTATTLGLTVDAFNDGIRIAEISYEGNIIDLMLKGGESGVDTTQGISHFPVVTPQGTIVNVGELAQVIDTAGPSQIRHIDRDRTVSIILSPKGMAMQDAMEKVQRDLIDKLKPTLPPGVEIRLAGTAEALNETWEAMQYMLLLAMVIVYLVMAILFNNFLHPFVVMFSVPLATAGAMLGLSALNFFGPELNRNFEPQTLDMLTMLGFVILIGIVVNNAILVVHQTLIHLREEGMLAGDAILEATRNRLRPIFMSTLTSVFGMLPLVLFPGAGSELYRGLGTVVVGGLSLSAILTLLIVPPLLTLILGSQRSPTQRLATQYPTH